MAFWIFMVVILSLIPLIMIIFGKRFITSPPKQINAVYGYRTPMSMKNQETWAFAHHCCGKRWYNVGRFLLLSIPLMLFVLGKDKDTIEIWGTVIVLLQLFPLIGTIVLTERALRKEFDQFGNPIKN